MMPVSTSISTAAPPILLQADRVRCRIAASAAVAALVAELAFGPTRRGDLGTLAAVTASRCTAASAGCR